MSTQPAASTSCAGGHCVTCSDDGVAMTVVRIDELRGLALCADADGGRQTVETALVEPVAAGEQLLVHAGVAIATLPADADVPSGALRASRRASGVVA